MYLVPFAAPSRRAASRAYTHWVDDIREDNGLREEKGPMEKKSLDFKLVFYPQSLLAEFTHFLLHSCMVSAGARGRIATPYCDDLHRIVSPPPKIH